MLIYILIFRDSLIQTALAEETRMASKLVNDTEMELYKRNFEIKKAAYDMEVETARAQAELAFQLQVELCCDQSLSSTSLYILGCKGPSKDKRGEDEY